MTADGTNASTAGDSTDCRPSRILQVHVCSREPRSDLLEHNSRFCDAMVLLTHREEASRNGWPILLRGSVPCLAFEVSRANSVDPRVVHRLIRNLRRQFQMDGILLLRGSEVVTGDPSALRLEVEHRKLMVETRCRQHRFPADLDNLGLSNTLPIAQWTDRRLFLAGEIDGWEAGARARAVESRPSYSSIEVVQFDGPLPSASGPTAPSFGRLVAQAGEGGDARERLEGASTRPTYHSGESGAFPADFHRDNLYLDQPPFEYLWKVHQPLSVLDLGCGHGHYLDLFSQLGSEETIGVDFADRPAGLGVGSQYLRRDLRKPLDLARKFDLVLCTEVAEHLSPELESTLLGNISRHASARILFSAAHPGQPGLGHVNCRPQSYWLEQWRNLGWLADPFESLALRSLSTFYWFRRNLVSLRPVACNAPVHSLWREEDLECIETRFSPWVGEAPAVFTSPLTVSLPPLRARTPVAKFLASGAIRIRNQIVQKLGKLKGPAFLRRP